MAGSDNDKIFYMQRCSWFLTSLILQGKEVKPVSDPRTFKIQFRLPCPHQQTTCFFQTWANVKLFITILQKLGIQKRHFCIDCVCFPGLSSAHGRESWVGVTVIGKPLFQPDIAGGCVLLELPALIRSRSKNWATWMGNCLGTPAQSQVDHVNTDLPLGVVKPRCPSQLEHHQRVLAQEAKTYWIKPCAGCRSRFPQFNSKCFFSLGHKVGVVGIKKEPVMMICAFYRCL